MQTSAASVFWPVFFACIGGAFVFVGLLLETLSDKQWFKTLDSFKRWKSLKHCGEWLVIAGIVVEMVDAGVTAWEIKQADKINPLNQPIGLLAANVSLFENGTNRSRVDFSSPLGGKYVVWLKFRNSAHSDSGWPFELVCTSGNATLWTTNPSPGTHFPGSALFSPDGLFWDLEFGSSSTARIMDVIPANATVRDVADLDSVEFDAIFLRPGTETSGGKIILTINSTKKVFEIPPQRVLKAEEIPLTKAEKDHGYLVRFVSPNINKTVTLVSWAYKE